MAMRKTLYLLQVEGTDYDAAEVAEVLRHLKAHKWAVIKLGEGKVEFQASPVNATQMTVHAESALY